MSLLFQKLLHCSGQTVCPPFVVIALLQNQPVKRERISAKQAKGDSAHLYEREVANAPCSIPLSCPPFLSFATRLPLSWPSSAAQSELCFNMCVNPVCKSDDFCPLVRAHTSSTTWTYFIDGLAPLEVLVLKLQSQIGELVL